MKKTVLLLVSILCFGISYSQAKKNIKPINTVKNKNTKSEVNNQSKTETQDWIKEKIESFSHSFNDIEETKNASSNHYGDNKYEVDFLDGYIIITNIGYYNNPGFSEAREDYTLTLVYKMPITSLAKLNFVKVRNNYEIIFRIKSNLALISTSSTIESKILNQKEYNIKNQISLFIPQNLLIDNLPERLTKAFNKLIELYGGQVTKEVF